MEGHVRLVVTSNCLSSTKIIDLLGIRGDRTWNAGDVRERTVIREPESGWIINSTAEKFLHIEDHIKNIMELVDGLESNFKSVSEIIGCEVQISCTIYCDDVPQLNFSKATISWAGKLGASLDIDIYRT